MTNPLAETLRPGHGHKEMSHVEFPLTAFLGDNGLAINFDPKVAGGLIHQGETPVGYVKSPFWRTKKNDPTVHSSDLKPLFIQPKNEITLLATETGGELEMFAWDPLKGDLAPILGPSSRITSKLTALNGNGFQEEEVLFESLDGDAKKIGYSAELAGGCIENNFHHSGDPIKNTLAMTRALKYLMQFTESEGWYLTPIAAIPHRPIEPGDTNQDPYVQRIAMEYMGWQNVRHYLGSSWQVHVEMMDLESALKAVNLYQYVSPLLYGLSSASPFVHGYTNPNLASIYRDDDASEARINDHETYEALDGNDWLSIRYACRWRGSPSGGLFVEPLPEISEDLFRLAEQGLNDNDHRSIYNIPSPARVAGHHRDRVRTDIGPNGTLEISNMDTFGGNVQKLAAVQEFTRALMWKLQYFAKADRLQELTDNYPDLFKYPVTPEVLRKAHLFSLDVAKHGMEAKIDAGGNRESTARNLFMQLLQFVNEPLTNELHSIAYTGLPKGITEELLKSAITPTETDYSAYEDNDGITSLAGFYKSGKGTLAYWLKRRAAELMQIRGLHEQEAIKDCMNNLGVSYHDYLRNLNGQDVVNLFQS
ncbi:hypothetical protein HY612_02635 [Candidatus Roizmanbacteria bacterium]|nr:hypothetical protein [Candidatus Roizmanbacteria bacterium]